MPAEDVIKDRRFSQRIPVKFPVEMKDLAFVYKAVAVDLSGNGARVKLAENLAVGSELDLLLRPDGDPVVKLVARVVQLCPGGAGLAFRTHSTEAFEAAYNLFEGIVMRQPQLAIRLKQHPLVLPTRARLYPLPLKGLQLTGPEHWVYGLLKKEGTMIFDLRRTLGAEWDRLAWAPFALLERGVASTTAPLQD